MEGLRLFISEDNVIRFEDHDLSFEEFEARLERGKAKGETEVIGVMANDEFDLEFVKRVIKLLEKYDRSYIGYVHS